MGMLERYWTKGGRLNRVVVINGNPKPQSYAGELYSKRIEAMATLAKLDAVDLYGTGWASGGCAVPSGYHIGVTEAL